MPGCDERLAALAAMASPALREEWGRVTGTAVPRVSPSLLRLALAWEIQAGALGGLPRGTTAALDQLARGLTRTAPSAAGMRLVREWGGKVHVVLIGEDRVIRWDGREWRSLSEVARAITGTRWSGPAFFGLNRGNKAHTEASNVEMPKLSAQGPASEIWRPEHLRQAIDAARVALWSWNVDSDRFTMDERAFDLWGLPWADRVSFEDLSKHIHPADRDRVRAAFTGTRSTAGSYEIDFRIMLGDGVRWISARGQGADDGIVDRVMFGIFLDVTGRKQAEESHELLAGEMSHRVKNLLAVATGLTHISKRSATNIEDMAKDLIQRLTALGRAHDLVRPLPGREGKAALLGDLLSVLLAPYDDPGAFAGRIRVAVPRMGIGEGTATTLAMVFHELATNSVKHGALSVQTGVLNLSGSCDDTHLCLVWAEDGGPAVEGAPEMRGFGSKMISRSMSQQFDGALTYDWQSSGLAVTLRMRKDRLAT